MQKISNTKKGFTLVELLIVIGIIAILATTAVVILNPAELLAQARDGQRLNDLGSVNSAISLYASDVDNPDFGGTASNCTVLPTANTASDGPFDDVCTLNAARTVDGAGWVDIDLTTATQTPLSVLPIDPSNTADYFYGYRGDDANNAWKLVTRLESERHKDKMEDDGGDHNACTTYLEETCYFETGADVSL